MSKLTQEQQNAIEHILKQLKKQDEQLSQYTAVKAVAGSGKSSTLLALANRHAESSPKTDLKGDILYMVFNKSMQKEATAKGFPSRTEITTIHSLAYRNTVPVYGLKVGFLNYRDLKRVRNFQAKVAIIESLEDFFISKYLTFDDYLDSIEELNPIHQEANTKEAKLIMQEMKEGRRPSTHGFYLKLFHKVLVNQNGHIKPDFIPSLVLFDEAQDAAPVALEIFRALNAKQKVFVGDNLQNIYGFMKTVSIFDEIKDATQFPLTKSFRVSNRIASKVEEFCHAFIGNEVNFSGVDIPKGEVISKAFLSRTNSALIDKAIKLYEKQKPFNLTKDISNGFELPMAILSAGNGQFDMPKHLQYLKQDHRDYLSHKSINKSYQKSFNGFLREIHNEDPEMQSACDLVTNHGPSKLFKIQRIISGRKLDIGAKITLSTVHSSKGLEFDQVVLMDDMNNAVSKIIIKALEFPSAYKFDNLTKGEQGELYLYYVACTRCKFSLKNAKFIDMFSKQDGEYFDD